MEPVKVFFGTAKPIRYQELDERIGLDIDVDCRINGSVNVTEYPEEYPDDPETEYTDYAEYAAAENGGEPEDEFPAEYPRSIFRPETRKPNFIVSVLVHTVRVMLIIVLLYFSLPSLLVDRQALSDLCDSMGIYCNGGGRVSVVDAFRSATGDVRDRIVSKASGDTRIYLVYCRDNRRTTTGTISRELVKETLNEDTNRYEKLANISLKRNSGYFGYDNIAYDGEIDAGKYCRRAEELFELYQTCANRRQVETICLNFLRGLEATKLSVNGHLYFVPRHSMEKVDIFEDFIAAVSTLNKSDTLLIANSIFVIDDAKQRSKMTEEFYVAVKKEIAEYQERADYLIRSGCGSPAI